MKWKITVFLKSGCILRGIRETTLTDYLEVMNEIVPNIAENSFSCLKPEEEERKEAIIFKTSEVAALKIEVCE